MLFIFDKDGTLVTTANVRPANKPAEQKPLPGVVARIAQLRDEGHSTAIATNQGGVACGFISRTQAYHLAWDAAHKCGVFDAVAVCCYDPSASAKNPTNPYARKSNRRKPAPGMLIDIMRRLGYAPNDTVFVGDQNTDKQAAEAAGVKFIWACEFFR